jgi:light-regulated signal transduction histidine kinase (bacteriophytochrome)
MEPSIDASGEPLDLSFAHLRSVSAIHCEYLRNMGVGASMSISIINGGALWGLIACHHYEPRVLPMEKRVAAEMFGEFFSMQLEALIQKRRIEASTKAREFLDRLMSGHLAAWRGRRPAARQRAGFHRAAAVRRRRAVHQPDLDDVWDRPAAPRLCRP